MQHMRRSVEGATEACRRAPRGGVWRGGVAVFGQKARAAIRVRVRVVLYQQRRHYSRVTDVVDGVGHVELEVLHKVDVAQVLSIVGEVVV